MTTLPFLMTGSTITVFVDGVSKTIDDTHPNFTLVRECLRAGKFDSIGELFTLITAVNTFCRGMIEIDPDSEIVRYRGEEVHGSLTDRILSMMREGFEVDPLLNFLENLMTNPSKRAVDELYSFLEYGKMPITPDGHFLAYKRVRSDYKSVHDGKTDNSIGAIVEMPRNKVDEDSTRTCSDGLHFCSHEYLKSFSGEKVVVLKINPRDVVAIPRDYNDTKGRACRYEVVGELSPDEVERALSTSIWSAPVVAEYGPDPRADVDVFYYDDGRVGNDDDDDDDTAISFDEAVDLYHAGYLIGYRDGRARVPEADIAPEEEWNEGYRAGYEDGRAHKRKQYY